jgi:hypothetical protein
MVRHPARRPEQAGTDRPASGEDIDTATLNQVADREPTGPERGGRRLVVPTEHRSSSQ